MTSFSDFGLARPVADALERAGYKDPTPIQQKAIPLALEGRDILGIAQTGTGKTLAFSAPVLTHLLEDNRPAPKQSCRALILAPTRELAAQIAASFETYGQFAQLRTAVAFGGVKIGPQKKRLERGVHVLVATPGRLEDLMRQRALSLSEVTHLVLDEADQMMDLGFIHALKRIAAALPKERQTLFFSATMPKAIRDLSRQFLTDPVEVAVTPQATTAERVEQHAYFVRREDKPRLLGQLLKRPDVDQVIVFTRTKHGADRLVRQLAGHGVDASAIHGNKNQNQRVRALTAFRENRLKVLIATDIAARGIDISGLGHVINHELPNVPEQYVHRIGRTGRADRSGIAISLVSGDEKSYLRSIEKLIGQPVARMGLPDGFEEDRSDLPPPKPQQPQGKRPKPQQPRAKQKTAPARTASGGGQRRAPRGQRMAAGSA